MKVKGGGSITRIFFLENWFIGTQQSAKSLLAGQFNFVEKSMELKFFCFLDTYEFKLYIFLQKKKKIRHKRILKLT